MRRGPSHRLVQQRQTFLLPTLPAQGTSPETGFRVVFGNHESGHLVHKAIHAGPAFARQRLQTFVFFFRQTNRQASQ